ncbi:MAG: response regulator [Desulfuromonadales bacterium]|nr:response regulator [Desulfuromonadales bacterium]
MKKDEVFTLQEERVLVLAPTPRDTQICCETLAQAGITGVPCGNLTELCNQLEAGAGAALLTEEAFSAEGVPLQRWLQAQPSWSDFPLLFLTRGGAESLVALRAMNLLGHVILLERPLRKALLVSAARAALRERRRQYQTRRHLEMLDTARQAAEEASRAKSEFLANMSHEIRTPMTVFMGVTEHLLQIDQDPEHRTFLKMAEQSAQRLRVLIDDILDLSRIEARGMEVEEAEFEIRSCLRSAVDLFTLAAREKNLRLEMEVAAEVPFRVVGDPDKLGQVLINLIGNALKFTHEGEVRISVLRRTDALEFAVADTGIGIPEEKQHLLFQSFSQMDSSFQRQYGGSGLGLAISKGLIHLMGGEIAVRSRKGRGTVFTFTLPLKTESNFQSTTPVKPPPEEPARKNPSARILLAEDDLMVQEIVKMILAQGGWQTETAKTGREAVEKWEGGDFDLILMDLQMPEMNGIEATQTIREREAKEEKRICIIGLTAHVRREITDDCLQAGMDRVLTKPIQMKDLHTAIDICLSDKEIRH